MLIIHVELLFHPQIHRCRRELVVHVQTGLMTPIFLTRFICIIFIIFLSWLLLTVKISCISVLMSLLFSIMWENLLQDTFSFSFLMVFCNYETMNRNLAGKGARLHQRMFPGDLIPVAAIFTVVLCTCWSNFWLPGSKEKSSSLVQAWYALLCLINFASAALCEASHWSAVFVIK